MLKQRFYSLFGDVLACCVPVHICHLPSLPLVPPQIGVSFLVWEAGPQKVLRPLICKLLHSSVSQKSHSV